MLRALAATLVVICHALGAWTVRSGVRAPDVRLEVLGGLGVKVFFVISGLIITLSVMRMGRARGGAATAGFLRRRLIRIVPLYVLATVGVFLREAHGGHVSPAGDVARSLLFIPFSHDPVVAQGWTLDYEMLFYVVVAAALMWSARARYAVVFVALGGLVLVRQAGVLTDDVLDPLYRWADPILVYFLAGMALALVRDRLRARLDVTVSLLAVSGVVTALLVAYSVAVDAGLGHAQSIAIDLPLCVACVALVTIPRIGAGAATGSARDARALAIRTGDASYSTYLTHQFVLGGAGHALALVHLAGNDVVFALGEAVAATAVGIVVYVVVERPMLRSLNARFSGRPAAALVPA